MECCKKVTKEVKWVRVIKMGEKIREYFSKIEDPRCECDVKHKLTDILILVMCAALCGVDTLEKIVEYGKNKIDFLSEQFGITKIPSRATLARILAVIDGDMVGHLIVEIMREMIGISSEVIAVDGKTICSTKRSEIKKTLHILTAIITKTGVTLGQLAVDEKTNEIPCMLPLLGMIDIKGKVITADAMHTQKDTVAEIVKHGGDYCIGLKGNQGNLHADVKLYFDDILSSKVKSDKELYRMASTSEKSRDRYEKRTCYLLNDISWLVGAKDWAGLKSVFAVKREVMKNGVKTEETSYYMSSLKTKPERFLEIVREHWKIESLHWMLDVLFGEDDCRLMSENAQKTMNVMRKLALCLHKNYKEKMKIKKALSQSMFSCLLNDKLLLQILTK